MVVYTLKGTIKTKNVYASNAGHVVSNVPVNYYAKKSSTGVALCVDAPGCNLTYPIFQITLTSDPAIDGAVINDIVYNASYSGNTNYLNRIQFNAKGVGASMGLKLFDLSHGGLGKWTTTTPCPSLWFIYANFTSLPANTGRPNIRLLDCTIDDTGCIGGATQILTINYFNGTYRIANTIAELSSYDTRYTLYANQTIAPCKVYSTSMTIRAGVTITADIVHFNAYNRLYATSALTGNIYVIYSNNSGGIDGTISGNYEVLHSELQAGDVIASVTNMVAHYSPWNISGVTTCTGYTAILSSDINANNKAFTLYGTRIDIDGTIGANATWVGHYLNAAGVTCGAGETFYGLHFVFTGIGVGGNILGALFTDCSISVTGNGQYIQAPVMTTLNLPGAPAAGMICFDSTTSKFKGWDGGAWRDFH